MPQVHCYLNQKTADEIEQIRQEEGHESLSAAMKEMLILGIKVHQINKDKKGLSFDEKQRAEKEEELKALHTTYLLRILEINADVLRCVFDPNKIPNSQEKVGDHIVKIKSKVDEYIEKFIAS